MFSKKWPSHQSYMRQTPRAERSRTVSNHPTRWSNVAHCSVLWGTRKQWDRHDEGLAQAPTLWAGVMQRQKARGFCDAFHSELCILDFGQICLWEFGAIQANVEKHKQNLSRWDPRISPRWMKFSRGLLAWKKSLNPILDVKPFPMFSFLPMCTGNGLPETISMATAEISFKGFNCLKQQKGRKVVEAKIATWTAGLESKDEPKMSCLAKPQRAQQKVYRIFLQNHWGPVPRNLARISGSRNRKQKIGMQNLGFCVRKKQSMAHLFPVPPSLRSSNIGICCNDWNSGLLGHFVTKTHGCIIHPSWCVAKRNTPDVSRAQKPNANVSILPSAFVM